jgi:hypothetical protein
MSAQRQVTRADIMAMPEYGKVRKEQRRRITAIKRLRRLEVGPYSTFYFENYDTMWHQIHEMLFVEKGGEPQIQDEMDAYNPLIPDGNELVATLMFEIPDPARRAAVLQSIGGIENHVLMSIGGQTVRSPADPTRENTSPEGKASSVQFVRFPLTDIQKKAFASPGETVMIGFDHPHYGHLAVVPAATREALAEDFAA